MSNELFGDNPFETDGPVVSDAVRLARLERKASEHEDALDRLLTILEGLQADAKMRATTAQAWTTYRAADSDGVVADPHEDEWFVAVASDLERWLAWAWPTILQGHAQGKALPPCWAQHDGVLEEFLALFSAWRAAYDAGEPNESRIAWHDRWAPATAQRVMLVPYQLGNCTVARCSNHRNPR